MELFQVIILVLFGLFIFQFIQNQFQNLEGYVDWNNYWKDQSRGRTLGFGQPYYWMFRQGIDKPCLPTKGCKNCHYDHYDYKSCDAHSGTTMYINDWNGRESTKCDNCFAYQLDC